MDYHNFVVQMFKARLGGVTVITVIGLFQKAELADEDPLFSFTQITLILNYSMFKNSQDGCIPCSNK